LEAKGKKMVEKDKDFLNWFKGAYRDWESVPYPQVVRLWDAWKAGKEHGYNLAERAVGRRGEGG
jgi:hypothetical protein